MKGQGAADPVLPGSCCKLCKKLRSGDLRGGKSVIQEQAVGIGGEAMQVVASFENKLCGLPKIGDTDEPRRIVTSRGLGFTRQAHPSRVGFTVVCSMFAKELNEHCLVGPFPRGQVCVSHMMD